jgi:hypothetical protein
MFFNVKGFCSSPELFMKKMEGTNLGIFPLLSFCIEVYHHVKVDCSVIPCWFRFSTKEKNGTFSDIGNLNNSLWKINGCQSDQSYHEPYISWCCFEYHYMKQHCLIVKCSTLRM